MLDSPDEGKTLDALDVVQGTAEDKVVGVGRGTLQSPRHYKIICEDFVDAKHGCNFVNWESTVEIFKI
jgi:hypothetical protein